MFDDPQKELRRLEQQLLAEEAQDIPDDDSDDGDGGWLDDELAEAHRLLGDLPEEEDDEDMDRTRIYRDPAWRDGQPRIRNYANGYGTGSPTRNRDRVDIDLEEYSDQIYEEPEEKSVRGLVLLACMETLGIVGLVLYWLVVLL